MTWETRRNGRYYYSATKQKGRVIKSYIGAGVAGALAAEIDATDRADRQRQQQRMRAFRKQLEAVDQRAAAAEQSFTTLVRAACLVAKQHGTNIGESRMEPKQHSSSKPAVSNEQLADLVQRAQRGDQTAKVTLRETLDRTETWQSATDLAQLVEDTWIALTAGNDMSFAECLHNELESKRAQLRGQEPISPLENLAIQHVTTSWLQLQYADLAFALGQNRSLRDKQYLVRRQEQATSRYNSALKTLATVRRPMRPASKVGKSPKRREGSSVAPWTTN